jgi:hypothetical protein
VDDLLITGADEKETAKFKLQMKELFKMSDLGLLSYYLGIEVHQKPGEITLCQRRTQRRYSRVVLWKIESNSSSYGTSV